MNLKRVFETHDLDVQTQVAQEALLFDTLRSFESSPKHTQLAPYWQPGRWTKRPEATISFLSGLDSTSSKSAATSPSPLRLCDFKTFQNGRHQQNSEELNWRPTEAALTCRTDETEEFILNKQEKQEGHQITGCFNFLLSCLADLSQKETKPKGPVLFLTPSLASVPTKKCVAAEFGLGCLSHLEANNIK